MKVHVFDTYVTIKDREGHPDMDDTLLEKLDEMLTTYGVPHAFTLPHEKTMEDCPEATLEVAYEHFVTSMAPQVRDAAGLGTAVGAMGRGSARNSCAVALLRL